MLKIPSLLIDNQASVYKAVEFLISQGHKEIALLNNPENTFFAQEIYSGYSQALKDNDISVPHNLIKHIPPSRNDGYQTTCELMGGGNLPSALITANELTAIGAIEALKIAGLFIPEDISLIAYGDSLVSQSSAPKLTTIKLPAKELGSKAMKLMLDLLERKDDNKREFTSIPGQDVEVLEGELILRESH
jgi:DNA-binding LacI/PurR family transcriptional regulator